MAIARRFKVSHDEVFPHGAYVVGEVLPVVDFDRSSKENRVQKVDPDSDMLLWQVDVLDADPEAPRGSKTLSVKIAAKVQPVPPAVQPGTPFARVVFEGLTALPYIDDNGPRARIAWSFRASGMSGGQAVRPADGKAA